jgi:hypothetical protein
VRRVGPDANTGASAAELIADDLLAVLDAADSDRATVFDIVASNGALFAATYLETSRAAASRIPGARFVELPGSEHDIFLGDTAPVLAEVAQFLRAPDTRVQRTFKSMTPPTYRAVGWSLVLQTARRQLRLRLPVVVDALAGVLGRERFLVGRMVSG